MAVICPACNNLYALDPGYLCPGCGTGKLREVDDLDRLRLSQDQELDARDNWRNLHFWERRLVAQFVIAASTKEQAVSKVQGWIADDFVEKRAREKRLATREPSRSYLRDPRKLEYDVKSVRGRWRVEVYRWIPK